MNIALDDIRSKAPEGATHYFYCSIFEIYRYFKLHGFDVYQYEDEWLWVDRVNDYKTFYSDLKPLN